MTTIVTSIVVVTYNSASFVAHALEPLHELVARGDTEVIVVDNASSDGTSDYVRQRFPWVQLIASEENHGYGRGNNLGFRYARGRYLLILNPDAAVDAAALDLMVAFMEAHPRCGAASPSIVKPNGEVGRIHAVMTPAKMLAKAARLRTFESVPVEPGSAPIMTAWLPGAILLVRSALYRSLGGFDPRFFLYFEETDLCNRIRERGLELWALGEAVGRHEPGSSAKKSNEALMLGSVVARHYYESRFYYLCKHHGTIAASAAEIGEIAADLALYLPRKLMGRSTAELESRLRLPILRTPAPPP